MFKNALVYRILEWERPALAEIEKRLASARFVACGATQLESAACLGNAVERRHPPHLVHSHALRIGGGQDSLEQFVAAGGVGRENLAPYALSCTS